MKQYLTLKIDGVHIRAAKLEPDREILKSLLLLTAFLQEVTKSMCLARAFMEEKQDDRRCSYSTPENS